MINAWDLWSKTDNGDPQPWHSLPWHLLEVGAVAQMLWEVSVRPIDKNRICSRLGLTEPEVGLVIGFLASLHDFGKASPRFQSMSSQQVQRLQSIYGAEFQRDGDSSAMRHSLITWGLVVPLLESEFGWTERIAMRYAEISAAHHGRFWTPAEFDSLKDRQSKKRSGQVDWHDLHHQLFVQLRESFGITDDIAARLNAEFTNEPNFLTYEDSLWLTGLISVADWIGSDRKYFPFRTDAEESYSRAFEVARESASDALLRTGWASPPLTIDSSSMEKTILSVENFVPRAAQVQAENMIRDSTSHGMTVVEIPMGWGKTEIALWIAAYYAESAGVTGTYFALPTMATSDQLYQRVDAHLQAHAKATGRTRIVPLQLLHGMADLSAMDEMDSTDGLDSLQLVAERIDSDADPDANHCDITDRNSVVRRARWFTRKKHGLLARYGVGTVDQALMSVLLTPHLFVRLFGLSGKTIIFDEVHAYDLYMSRLFDRLLEFLGALGSPVVVLSATLPQHRTQEMLAAYTTGAKWSSSSPALASYPRISVVDDSRVVSTTVQAESNDLHTTLNLEWYPSKPDTMWSELSDKLVGELREGGTVAIICNTVSGAQECYSCLQKSFQESELTLFHARFRQQDRARIQEDVLDRFGKDATNRPWRHIVVATQVIEQSLDLDFDLMVSMFAPSDLLLQRAGRLQRHRKWDQNRAIRFKRPRLWIIGFDQPTSADGPTFFEGSVRVYGEHVMLRSWLALAERSEILVPDDLEAVIESTYGPLIDVPEGMKIRYAKAEEIWLRDTDIQSKTSESVLLPELAIERLETRTDVLVKLSQVKPETEDAPESHQSRLALTRLGPATISLIILSKKDLNGLSFDPQGQQDSPLSSAHVRVLLRYAVSISDHGVVTASRAIPVPPIWEQSAHLRHRRLILLDENAEAMFGSTRICLDDVLGIRIVRGVRGVRGEGQGEEE